MDFNSFSSLSYSPLIFILLFYLYLILPLLVHSYCLAYAVFLLLLSLLNEFFYFFLVDVWCFLLVSERCYISCFLCVNCILFFFFFLPLLTILHKNSKNLILVIFISPHCHTSSASRALLIFSLIMSESS